MSNEWFRPNPPLPFIKWGPRNNTNIQQSAVLLSLSHVAKNRQTVPRELLAEEQAAIAKGKSGPTYAWVIPAGQRRKADTADRGQRSAASGTRDLARRRARSTPVTSTVAAGDYIVRGDQPFRTLAEMYFSMQNYPPQNPSPYDDTGLDVPVDA